MCGRACLYFEKPRFTLGCAFGSNSVWQIVIKTLDYIGSVWYFYLSRHSEFSLVPHCRLVFGNHTARFPLFGRDRYTFGICTCQLYCKVTGRDDVTLWFPYQITATHQLQTAVTSLALVSRAIILASAKEEAAEQSLMLDSESATSLKEILVMAMFNTLMGLDANDPPKTLATMQFYCYVFSSVSIPQKNHSEICCIG